MLRPRAVVGVGAAVVLLVSSCGEVSGSAHPVTGGSQEVPTEGNSDQRVDNLPQNGAPAVSDPLDTESIDDDPCVAMTDDQAEDFPGKFSGTSIKSGSCLWQYDGDEYGNFASIGGSLELNNHDGLTKYYGDIDEDIEKVEPVDPVHGYPAIHVDLKAKTDGNCLIKVGVRDDVVYDSLAILEREHPSRDSPCDVAREFAGVVVDNLKEAQ